MQPLGAWATRFLCLWTVQRWIGTPSQTEAMALLSPGCRSRDEIVQDSAPARRSRRPLLLIAGNTFCAIRAHARMSIGSKNCTPKHSLLTGEGRKYGQSDTIGPEWPLSGDRHIIRRAMRVFSATVKMPHSQHRPRPWRCGSHALSYPDG